MNEEDIEKEFTNLQIINGHLYIRIKVLECNNRTLTICGVPSFLQPLKGFSIDNAINIIDYIGTSSLGIMYLDAPISVEVNTIINITNLNITF